MKKSTTKKINLTLLIVFSIVFSMFYIFKSIPQDIIVRTNSSEVNINKLIKLEKKDIPTNSTINLKSNDKNFMVSLFGIIPFKDVSVISISNDVEVYPSGMAVGVKLKTKGVLVVSLIDIEVDENKTASPATESGILVGDNIIKINDSEILNSEKLVSEIKSCEGQKIKLTILRRGEIIEKTIEPVKQKESGKYKIGIWVRDSTAGVGTITFYDKKTGKFGALGHPVTDVDTGTTLEINDGEIVKSSIVNIRKGEKGSPGELKGIFIDEDNLIGTINKNTKCGIFGELNDNSILDDLKPMKIALRDEIKPGKAQILTTIDDEGPKLYDIEIEKLLVQEVPGPKSMIIKIVDDRLLNKTNGIVQGMSGSPIIQEDKIIGAVTHVLVNKPETGYGIYIEWMLKDSGILAN